MKSLVKLGSILTAALLLIAALPLILPGTAGSAAPDNLNNPDNEKYITEKLDSLINNEMILFIGSPFALVKGKRVPIDPFDLEIAPVIKDDTRMVPLRFIAESFDAKVEWDQKKRSARVLLQDKVFSFKQESKTAAVNDKEYILDTPVREVRGRTFVPLMNVVEMLGKKAFFDRGLIIITDTENVLDSIKDRAVISELITRMSYLPKVGSRDKLMELMEEACDSTAYYGGGKLRMDLTNAQLAKKEMSGSSTADYSPTNVQVQGVDEADIVKTDGEYIYQVNRQRVVVSKAYPPDEMKVLSMISYEGEEFTPKELYLKQDKLVVIGETRGVIPLYRENGNPESIKVYPPQMRNNTVKALIYDTIDRKSIKKLREVELEGCYVSSRMTGSSLYIIANKQIDYRRMQEGQGNLTPSYRDTLGNAEYESVDYNSISYFPGIIQPNYLMVAGVDIDGNEAVNIDTYLGAGQDIYASKDNLYIAVPVWKEAEIKLAKRWNAEESTVIYKFALKDGRTTYLCKGEVPGRILNQFSMDESGGYFRVASTKGDMWRTDEGISRNNLYILDDVLSITGSVEGMAPGERIYSVRFIGDRAYVVTFKKVDPLFVIDLKDPSNPSILGSLKIPGYSDYLHPYDENHIIGFGKDTVEIKEQAYYQGMKIALFDVTDVSRPIQKFSEIIGDRGTDSELLNNHKALLFSKEKNLIAFPVTLMEAGDIHEDPENKRFAHGEFTFQGAYVYNLDLAEGFKFKGRITHLSDVDMMKAGMDWYDSDKNVNRILYIGDMLYTLSNSMIKANAMEDLKEMGQLAIPSN